MGTGLFLDALRLYEEPHVKDAIHAAYCEIEQVLARRAPRRLGRERDRVVILLWYAPPMILEGGCYMYSAMPSC